MTDRIVVPERHDVIECGCCRPPNIGDAFYEFSKDPANRVAYTRYMKGLIVIRDSPMSDGALAAVDPAVDVIEMTQGIWIYHVYDREAASADCTHRYRLYVALAGLFVAVLPSAVYGLCLVVGALLRFIK